jgi:hypothetical protein
MEQLLETTQVELGVLILIPILTKTLVLMEGEVETTHKLLVVVISIQPPTQLGLIRTL